MNDFSSIALLLLAGIILGVLFFGGLWLTVRKLSSLKNPTLWYFASYLVRMAVVMTGFYFLTQGDWRRLLPVLGGFLIARFLIARLTKNGLTTPNLSSHEN